MTTRIFGVLPLFLASMACTDARASDAPVPSPRRVEISLTESGFSPSPIHVEAGQPLDLVITRRTDKTCAREVVVAGLDIRHDLPLDKPVVISLTPKSAGEIKYACGMDMVRGVLIVDPPAAKPIEIVVTEKGFEPSRIPIQRGVETRLLVTRKTDKTCARDILIPTLHVREALPLDKPVEVKFTATKAGELQFGCAMNGMVGGLFIVE